MDSPPVAPSTASPHTDYPADVTRIATGTREFILVGTAHISRESVDLVREVIEREQPDYVCIELDERRYRALRERDRFESLDLKEIVRQRQLSTLMLSVLLVSYQKRLGGKLGVVPGTELLEAACIAEDLGIPVALSDRDVRTTLRRAWSSMSWWQQLQLLPAVASTLFEKQELSEDDLRTLRDQDAGSKLIEELGEIFPALKKALIDERDTYLAEKIRRTPGDRIVAVVGAGHVIGVRKALLEEREVDLTALEAIPPPSPIPKWIGWGIPAVILGAIGLIGVRQGLHAAGDSLLFWTLANGIPSMLGAILAWAHPLTIMAAFVVAPIASLTPVIGTGYVTAFVQSYFQPPLVRELRTVAEDIGKPSLWWRNRLLRIFLVFVLTTLGSLIGTAVGGAEILAKLFG